MKRLLRALALVMGVGAAATGWAQAVPDTNTPTMYTITPWQMGNPEMVTGMGQFTGRAALPGKNRLLIVQKKTTSQLYITKHTQFVDAQGTKLASDTLREGDQVKVDFDIRGNTALARKVTIIGHDPSAP
ncbi:MAG: hypothetical protein JST54_07765 [Deltaproteobacteria bacterium]|nr:hypothetical protein [Deltaproteobacteria bacterium]